MSYMHPIKRAFDAQVSAILAKVAEDFNIVIDAEKYLDVAPKRKQKAKREPCPCKTKAGEPCKNNCLLGETSCKIHRGKDPNEPVPEKKERKPKKDKPVKPAQEPTHTHLPGEADGECTLCKDHGDPTGQGLEKEVWNAEPSDISEEEKKKLKKEKKERKKAKKLEAKAKKNDVEEKPKEHKKIKMKKKQEETKVEETKVEETQEETKKIKAPKKMKKRVKKKEVEKKEPQFLCETPMEYGDGDEDHAASISPMVYKEGGDKPESPNFDGISPMVYGDTPVPVVTYKAKGKLPAYLCETPAVHNFEDDLEEGDDKVDAFHGCAILDDDMDDEDLMSELENMQMNY